MFVEPRLHDPGALEKGELGISRKGRRADRDGVLAGAAKGPDQDVDRVVGAAGDDEIVRSDAV
jgi:hypothetical protein